MHGTPFTLHPLPYTLHRIPCTLHSTLFTLHLKPYTLHPTPYTLHPTPHRRPTAATPRRVHTTPPTIYCRCDPAKTCPGAGLLNSLTTSNVTRSTNAQPGSGMIRLLFDTMHSLICSRKSTPPQNRQLNILTSNCEQQVDDLAGELLSSKYQVN